jgi:hypothetical protein
MSEKSGEERPDGNEEEKITYRGTFGLYVMLICGILVFLIGLYLYFSFDPAREYLIFDGEEFRNSKIQPLVFVFAGLIICIFPVYCVVKDSGKIK